ncbi:NADPH2:quinone reductase [Kribbella orskensis]|uniref:NADPH2:quinone reductase n=1 Tax=Kribbella orskensis TaxID=2512216 RepID=A0ABY2BJR5_9ACTN|nr:MULTISPECIES: quinone oxidoreductase [Kribbella]TCN40093.1 NADPH2:quinone reductase [Kribbella sp. VKM Ac-2500]TCO22713.1 NADPH2:quinone reductase [Kribbella orskensis]
MKVIEAVDRDTLRLVERASIPLQAGEVRIAVVAAGVNYLDIQERTGAYPREFPYVPGGEGSGVVTEVAPDVSTPMVGQRVCWQGVQASYADEAVAPAWKVIPLPAEVSHQQAAAILLQGLTAQYLTTDSYAVQPGDLIVVHAGAGGVGLLLTQLAKSLGAKVITTVSTQQKAALSQAAGADQAVAYEDLRSTVAGRAAAVYDSVGRTTFEDSLHALAPRGTLILYGQSSGPVPPFDLSRLGPIGSLTITRPTLRHFVSTPASLHSQAALLFDHLKTGTLTPPITTTYPLADAAEAHEALQSRSTTGKLLLLPAPTTLAAPDRAPRPAPE